MELYFLVFIALSNILISCNNCSQKQAKKMVILAYFRNKIEEMTNIIILYT